MNLRTSITELVKTPGLLKPGKLLEGLNRETVSHEEVVRVYRELVKYIDILMLHEADKQTEEIEEGDINELEDILHLRRLVIEQTLITFPILRGIHQVEGIPNEEEVLGDKINMRDELSVDILHLLKQIEMKEDELNVLKPENKELIKEIKSKRRNESKIKESIELIKLKEKSYSIIEQIHGLIITNGLDWNKDEELKNIIFYCSDIYKI